MTESRDEIVEELIERKGEDLEEASKTQIEAEVDDYASDLDDMSDEEIVKEYERVFGTKVEIESED